jgi:hypothetical protein
VIEISNEGSNSTKVDHYVDNSDGNGNGLVGTYSISGRVPESRFVRLRQIGKNHYGDGYLVVSDFELLRLCTPDNDADDDVDTLRQIAETVE